MNTNMFRTTQNQKPQAQSQNGFAQNSRNLLGQPAAPTPAKAPQYPPVSDQVAEALYPQIQELLISLGFPMAPGKVTIGRVPDGNTITLTDFGIKRDQPNANGSKVKNLMNVTLGWMKQEGDQVVFAPTKKETILKQLEYHQRMVQVHTAMVKFSEHALTMAQDSSNNTNPGDGQE